MVLLRQGAGRDRYRRSSAVSEFPGNVRRTDSNHDPGVATPMPGLISFNPPRVLEI